MMNANIIAHGTSRFREMFEHSDVVFNDNGTLSTKPLHPLTYIPEMSNGTEEDLVIMPNIALFVSITFVNDTRIRRNFYLFYQMRNTINVQRTFFSDKTDSFVQKQLFADVEERADFDENVWKERNDKILIDILISNYTLILSSSVSFLIQLIDY